MADIAAAFVAAERLFDMPAIWDAIETAKIDETIRAVAVQPGRLGDDARRSPTCCA